MRCLKLISYYLHPDRRSDRREQTLIKYLKLQIDTSLAIGWEREDLIILSNVELEHDGVRTLGFDSWFTDPKKALFNKYKCLDYVQRLNPDAAVLISDHDAFQLRTLDLSLAERRPITSVNYFYEHFQDTFCLFSPASARWVNPYVKQLEKDLEFRFRKLARHEGAYSGELNQGLVFNEENGYVARDNAGTRFKLKDLISNSSTTSLEPLQISCAWNGSLEGYDVVHLHLDNYSHREAAMTSPVLAKFLYKYQPHAF